MLLAYDVVARLDEFMSLFILTPGRQSKEMKTYVGLLSVACLLFVQATPLAAQQIPADELPPPGTDTGLDGKYDPQNGLARLIRGEDKDVARIFEDEHVLVFMPRGEVVAPGHVLVIPKRMGARNLLDLKPDELRELLVTVQKAATAQRKGLGATGFKVIQNNGLSSSQTAYHAHFHVVPSFGGKAPGPAAPRRALPDAEYDAIATKLRAAWPK